MNCTNWQTSAQLDGYMNFMDKIKNEAFEAAAERKYFRLPRRMQAGRRLEMKLTYIGKLFIDGAADILGKNITMTFDAAADRNGADFVVSADGKSINLQVKELRNLNDEKFITEAKRKYAGKNVKLAFFHNERQNVIEAMALFFENILSVQDIKLILADRYIRNNAQCVWKL